MLITINPLNPTSLPELKFLGSDVDVQRQKDIISENMHVCIMHKNYTILVIA